MKDIIEGKATKKEAEISLGLTRMQIDRLIIKLKKEGIDAFSDKNKGNLHNKKISLKIENERIDLYLSDYYDYNFSHFYEEIIDKYNISFSSLVTILSKADIVSPEAQNKTMKAYYKEMKETINYGKVNDKKFYYLKKGKKLYARIM